MQSQLVELCARCPAGDAQQEGGPGLLPAGLPQDAGQQQPIELPGRSRRSLLPLGRRPEEPHPHDRLAHQAGDLQRLAEHAVQLLQVQRLEQVIVGAFRVRWGTVSSRAV